MSRQQALVPAGAQARVAAAAEATTRRAAVYLLAVWVVAGAGCSRAVADANSLYGIHWWGYTSGQPIDAAPGTVLDSATHGAWDLETVLTHSASWWSASYFLPLYQNLYTTKNVSLITRIDYNWGETVPSPTNANYANWPTTCVGVVNTLKSACHIWIIGNEPNINGEGNNWPDNKVTPAGYAQVYRNVRNAIHASAGASPAGPHRVLIAPASPGGIIDGVRWIDGNDWLGQVIDHIPAAEIDGFALHAYGGSVADFAACYQSALAVIDSKGLQDRAAYITEWNRYTNPAVPSEEAATAQFLRDALANVHAWNQGEGHHNIVATTWFVYDADQQAGNGWNGHSIEYWKNNGYAYGDSRDLYTALEQAVDLHYPAGLIGTRGVTANFTGSPVQGKAPLAVQFTDESTGTITAWSWTFGDGGSSTARNPSHTYTQLGTYSVTLTVSGNGTGSLTRPNYISVVPQPADFDGDGDVDQEDFGAFQKCLTGESFPQDDVACGPARLDADVDVDQYDTALFITCYSGPGASASFDCANP